ncbi:hypothetical protein [Filomicrobium sp.]|uniref:RNA-binding domain-containing protein n=1 Tax=Filomicrobium sp. TaxID=2024831 RepID=UPI00258A0CE8|nr:hypothetical protein [Filomicrobium sp.]MCV0369525.1 ATP-binding protein [Filomicrobium sp.]
MARIDELQPLLAEPREDLSVEYKGWLDLRTNDHRALLAKASIALANHGGGFIIIGFDEVEDVLRPIARPSDVPLITQDAAISESPDHAAKSQRPEKSGGA